MRVDDIIDKLVEKFQNEPNLQEIFIYHKVNGILPDIGTSLSIGCDSVKYSDYSSALDEVEANISIYIYTQESDPEIGEKNIRNLVDNARYILTEDHTLSGLISCGTLGEVEYLYVGAGEALLLHTAVLRYKAVFYQERQREKNSAALVEITNITIERSE